MQVSPAAQGAPELPHWHPPAAVHPSETVVSQGVHAPPGARPQIGKPGAVQAFDRQHPTEQAVASQVQIAFAHS